MVAAGGLDAARELLGDQQEGTERLPPQRHPAWVRTLAFTLALIAFMTFAVTVAVPLFD